MKLRTIDTNLLVVIILTIVAVVLVFIVPSQWLPLRVLTLPLAFVLPGYALMRALFPGKPFGNAERITFSLGISVSIVILGGLVLNSTTFGLQARSWAVLLGVITLTASAVFTSLSFGSGVITIIQQDGIQYLVVDHRLSTSLPYAGTYFNLSGASSESAQQIQSASLTKFDSVQNVSRIFDSGDIVIYSVAAILHPPAVIPPTYCKPTPSTTATSNSSLIIATDYAGKLYDLSDGVTTGMTLTGLQQLQGGICGSLGGLPMQTHTTGMPPNGSFKGDITPTGQIQFTVTSGSGQPSFTFSGVIMSDGNIAGSYCGMVKATGSCSNYGLWSVSPKSSG